MHKDEEQFQRAMMGFDGEDEASSGTGKAPAAAPAAKGGGDAMEVDAPAGVCVSTAFWQKEGEIPRNDIP